MDYEKLLRKDERVVYLLRDLHMRYGYKQFKAGKFESYELYAKNKDFIGGDGIISFTDGKGRLKALKPDVTLAIVNNYEYVPGEIKRFCYNDYVYRRDKNSGEFTDILQSGIECLGDITAAEVAEVITLAIKSLAIMAESDDDYVLDISHMGIIDGILEILGLPRDAEEAVLKSIREKSAHEAIEICKNNGIDDETCAKVEKLIGAYGPMDEVLCKLRELGFNGSVKEAIEELEEIDEALKAAGLDKSVRFDFSVISDMGYYNGVIFRGYLKDLAQSILVGGRYDNLIKKMGRKGQGLGFAVAVNKINELNPFTYDSPDAPDVDNDRMVNIALPKGRLGEKAYEILEKAGFSCEDAVGSSRKLVYENVERGVRYFWVKPSDVAIYVERGAADLGVVGKDILLENEADVYELLDLGFGKCRMMVAGKKDYVDDSSKTLRVATKFPHIATEYYNMKSRDIDIIKLNGSIEIAPLLGLSDLIVDIVETGNTLRANNLEIKEVISPISARLIANKSGFKFKTKQIEEIRQALEEQAE